MSLELARKVNAAHPQLLLTNIAATCSQFVDYLIVELRAAGHVAYRVGKTAGEGQYTPPGFVPRLVKGLDGKDYMITGVSHDALWCDGLQFDTVAQGNDSPDPIGMPGQPVWNPIPQQYWRPQNPPLVNDGPAPIPVPPPAPVIPYPGDVFFTEKVGIPLHADYSQAGQLMNAGSATWLARTIWDIAKEGLSPEASVQKHRNEWRAALGLPPL